MNIDTWIHDPKAHDEWYAAKPCVDCGEDVVSKSETLCEDCLEAGKEDE